MSSQNGIHMAWFKKKPAATPDQEDPGLGNAWASSKGSFHSTEDAVPSYHEAPDQNVMTMQQQQQPEPTGASTSSSSRWKLGKRGSKGSGEHAAAAAATASATGAAAGYQQQQQEPLEKHHSLGEDLHVAKEGSMSAAGVALLVLWIVAVTGWTGYQVVQNALWNAQLKTMNFQYVTDRKGLVNTGDPSISMEVNGMWLMVAIESAITLVFFTLAIALLLVPACHSCRQGVRVRRLKRSVLVWMLTLVLIATAWFKCFIISSIWNKMEYQGMFCANDNLDLGATFKGGQSTECKVAPVVSPMRMGLVWALLTIAFHSLVWFWHQPKGACGKGLVLVPMVLLVAFLLLKPTTAIMNFHSTQAHFTQQGNFTFTGELIVALIEFITAVWLSLYMGWAAYSLRLLPRFANTLLGCCGRDHEDIYYEHEHEKMRAAAAADAAEAGATGSESSYSSRRQRKSYSLRASFKAMLQQYYYMTQLPTVFGFVSPMITYFALGVHNWWVVFDIIVGAVFIFVYMLMCLGHRKILNPSKH